MAIVSVPPAHAPRANADQEIRFCRGSGDARIAYAVHGSGPHLVVVSCWLSHLQHDWQSPVWRHFLDDLGGISTLVRYDERGFGMSDWSVQDFSLDARVGDLEGVIAALGLERVALLGMSGGSDVAMAYAARHPERVTRLVLYGTGSGEPREMDAEQRAVEDTFRSMIRVGWAKEDPLFRRVFTRIFIPEANEEQMQWFDALQRMSTSPENAVASRIARQAVDITDEIPRIMAPTLVLQAVGDRATPFAGAPRVAAQIPAARLVPLESKNHILLAGEPAWGVCSARSARSLRPIAPSPSTSGSPLRVSPNGRSRCCGRPRMGWRTRRSRMLWASAFERWRGIFRTPTESSVSPASPRERPPLPICSVSTLADHQKTTCTPPLPGQWPIRIG